MKTVKEKINEAIVKHNIKNVNKDKMYDIPNDEYEYYKATIESIDLCLDYFDNPEEKEEYLNDLLNRDSRAESRFEHNFPMPDLEPEDFEDIMYDHIVDDVVAAFNELEDTKSVYKAFGITK